MLLNKKINLLLVFALNAFSFFYGCDQNPTEVTRNDEDNIRDLINSSGYDLYVNEWNGDFPYSLNGSSTIDPTAFYREYDKGFSKNIEINVLNRIANAKVEYTRTGSFKIVDKDSITYSKPIVMDKAVRYLYLEQNPESSGFGGWEVVSLSVLDGHSNEFSSCIEKIEINSESVKMEIDNPEELIRSDKLEFKPGENVELSVTLADTNFIAILHDIDNYFNWEHKQLELNDPETKVFKNTYKTPQTPGEYNTFVDIISKDCIFNIKPEYKACCWGMPYNVVK